MKAGLAVLCLVLFARAAGATPVEKMYYVGEAKLSSPAGQSFGSQAFLLEKTHDPDHRLIVERAIVVKPDGAVDEFTMNLQVQGDAFTIKDTKATVQGTGTLFGPAWHWTYFKAIYKSTNGAQIEDENYMTDPEVLVARKKISGPDAKVLMYMDITLKATTPKTFELLASALLKK
ncbi:MAG: hypothetical protein JO316_10405 [Abitibacteriaceae bacterium]|nr:hypothetical protein [Abditibacteriaceae bacterium]MBV9865753.1 hypothetical protein [Abditibacteriaceae bacterium]